MTLAHHLGIDADAVAGNGGRGRVFFVPGSVGRARAIAARFEDAARHDNPRGLTVWTGRLRVEVDGRPVVVDAGAVPTGMGSPSVGIVVTELINLGVRRLLRVGSAGSMQPEVAVGDVVIARAAVRDEGSSDAFAPRDVPAVAHPDWVRALERAAVALGLRAFTGLVHTKDTLYGREFPAGPLAGANRDYMRVLAELGVLASEMESSHLFMLAMAHGADVHPVGRPNPGARAVKAGTVLAIIGDEDHGWAPDDLAAATEARAVEVAVRAAAELIAAEDA